MREWLLGVAMALAVAGCSSGGNTSSTASTTAPTATATTETFTGTVSVGGNDFHPFTVTVSNGNISATLTAAGPPSTIFMGFGVGTPSGSVCTLISGGYTTTQAGIAAQLSGTITAGAYCLMVFDVGNQSAPITYSATVTHY